MSTDATSLLLERLSANPGAPPSMSELLAQLAESDPRMALVAKCFAARGTDQAETADESSEPVQKRESLARLQRIMKRLYRELEELRERNDSLAAALGACYLCWGEDPRCEVCAGAGTPGSNAPDEVFLSHYVTPAIRRLRSSPRPGPPPANGHSPSPPPELPQNPQ